MSDQFEARLDRLFGEYASRGVRPIDRLAIARATIAAGNMRPAVIWRGARLGPSSRLLLAALLTVALVATAAVLVGNTLNQQVPVLPTATVSPTASPAETASPSLPRAVGWAGGPIIIPLAVSTSADTQMTFRAYRPDGTWSDLDINGHSRSCPTFSPDGRSLAYIGAGAQEQLVIANPDGTGQQVQWVGNFNDQVIHQVVWSPDSRLVAAPHASAVDASGVHEVVVIGRREAATALTLDWGGGEMTGSIAWSPDGSQLAVIAPVYDAGATKAPSGWAIDIRDVVGTASRRIATAPMIAAIAWSPDGKTIAYIAGTTTSYADAGDLYFIDLDASAPRAISGGTRDRYSRYPAWSPDGRLLAVTASDGAIASGDGFDATPFEAVIFDRVGSEIHRIAGLSAGDGNVFMTWSPDSASLLFSLGGAQGSEVPGIVPINGGQTTYLDVEPYSYYTQCPLTWQATPTN